MFLRGNAEIFCETVLTEIVPLNETIVEGMEWGSGFIVVSPALQQQNM